MLKFAFNQIIGCLYIFNMSKSRTLAIVTNGSGKYEQLGEGIQGSF